jgi:hypothetical protein
MHQSLPFASRRPTDTPAALLRRAERELDRLSERVEHGWRSRDSTRSRRVSEELRTARDILRRVLGQNRAS